MLTHISVRGAREHNLKSIDVDIPRDKLVVITGLSGSGKSSLAFDTIYAEGQRRYVESLSAYARQFLEMMQKPDVDHIEGLSPAISIEQKTTSRNPRSTVGTVTEIYDYMRLLWARVGIPYSPATGLPIESQTVSQMVDRVMTLGLGARLYLLAPFVRGRKGEYKKELKELQKRGFQRVKLDGQFYLIDETPTLNKKLKHDIDIVVDRVILKEGIESRLADSIETALSLSDGLLAVETVQKDDANPPSNASSKSKSKAPDSSNLTGERLLLSAKFACPISGFTIDEIEPRLFSFNNPFGACPSCDGLGKQLYFDPALVVPEPDKNIENGTIAAWANKDSNPSPFYFQALQAVAAHVGVSITTPWQDLPEAAKQAFLYGTKDDITIIYQDGKRRFEVSKPFEGVIPNIERRWRETESNWVRDELSRFQSSAPCETCEGNRLKAEALAVKIAQCHVGQITKLSVRKALEWFQKLPESLSEKQNAIADKILREIVERLGFLNNVGLDYLSLSRASGTLSGGESQRIRLASQIGSGLTGVLYVLDEPSIGLHQRDNDRLLTTLSNLRDMGNTVLVVEHDEDAILAADYVIDMGPGAGEHGGQVLVAGSPQDIMTCAESLTGQYLTGNRHIPIRSERRTGHKDKFLTLKGASANNLKNVTARIPLGTMTCITGVSGSGKSTFTIETLYKAATRHLNGSRELPGAYESLEGLEHLDKIVDIDQSPIGRTPRSNPATYTGAFGPIRDWFAGLPEAAARGYKAGRFSFNVKGGRCEACQGDGVIKIEMHFLPDVYVQCDQCKGKRYNRETLEIRFKDKNIAEILDMTVEDGVTFFNAIPSIAGKLEMLHKVGLGYIRIGQQATTLSGGEAQRVKLAKELARRATGKTLYILDEPTTGLHFEDVRKLLEVLQALVDTGNSVVIIEHNLDVIKAADWIIDMGPEGGDGGGKIVAEGTPEMVAKVKASYTGRYLAPILARSPKN